MIEALVSAQGIEGWLYPFTVVLGLMVGSFLNVVIVRIPQRLQWQWHGNGSAPLAWQWHWQWLLQKNFMKSYF